MMARLGWHLPVFLLGVALALLAAWSMTVGADGIGPRVIRTALAEPEAATRETAIVWTVRLPRLLTAILAGSALAVAGAVMQAATGNPLADPGLMGVNAGAALAVVVLTVIHGPGLAVGTAVWAAFAGAALAAVTVYALGAQGRSGPTPVKLILAGVVIGTFLGVITMRLLILDRNTMDTVRFWTAGSLQGRAIADIAAVAPFTAAGLVLALMLRDRFTALSLGATVARGLGQNQALWRGLSALIVVLLAGSAVALARPLGFIGLVVPHVARLMLGADYRQIIPFALVGGAVLTVTADLLPRALWRNDVPVGITLALVGAPFFIWLARRA